MTDLQKQTWAQANCDKWDYLIAGFCGAAAGLIDILFVGRPGVSALGSVTDAAADELVKKTARLVGWKPKEGNENNIASAIGFFERNYAVNYDQKNTGEVGNRFQMAAKNHHYKSLSHSPDPIGLFFSILDQMMNTSSFLNNGQLIRIDTSDRESPLKGADLPSKLFSGFCNWLGHIMSDMAGSSGNRGSGSGRGTGVAIPFMELFQLCDFGQLQIGRDRQNLATAMTRVFQEGYDLRFGAAMALPVMLEEMMIRVLWVIKRHFYKKKAWEECRPVKEHADLRIMLLVGNATLCIIDGTDALIKGIIGGNFNLLAFLTHLNFVAWVRLVMLILRELRMRFGSVVLDILRKFEEAVLSYITPRERVVIQQFYARMQRLDLELETLFQEFVIQVEKEYQLFHKKLEESFSNRYSLEQRAKSSVELARMCHVKEEKIIKNDNDLRKFFS